MKAIEISINVSKKYDIPFYVGNYHIGFSNIEIAQKWFVFFKADDIPKRIKTIQRFCKIHKLGFNYNEDFKIFEREVGSQRPFIVINRNPVHRNEHGLIYQINQHE